MLTRGVFAAVLFLAAFAIGCGASSLSPATRIDETVVLAPGQTVSINGTSLRVGFVALATDSRCPADTTCIRQGEAVVIVRVTGVSLQSDDYRLSTSEGANFAVVDKVLLALTNLAPYPNSNQPIQPDAYRATLRITSR